MNLYGLLSHRPLDVPDKVAIETVDGSQWRYAALDAQTARYANALQSLHLSPGERVAVQVDKSPQSLFLYLACLRAGLVHVPMNTAYRTAEVEHIVGDAEPGAIVCRPADLEAMTALGKQLGVGHVLTLGTAGEGTLGAHSEGLASAFDDAPRADNDVAALIYTSGTTGRPKGVMLSHANLASNALALYEAWGWREDDVLVHALPLFHVHGLFVACHLALLGASTMLFLPRLDVAALIERLPRASVLMGVPTHYTRLLASPAFDARCCRTMRLFVCGSAPLLEQTFHEFQRRSGHTILERYGMSETGMNCANPLHGPRKPGSVGKPLAQVCVRVVDEAGAPIETGGRVGEVQVKGPNVFRGYWRQARKTATEFSADGYFKTGDLGCFDEDGFLSLVGRSKDLIISGGYNVYPKEVELLIDAMDGIVESAVVGLPHADYGEAVTAAVVAAPGAAAPAPAEIIASLEECLAGFKVPRQVVFVEALPRNAMGKVQKNTLREQLLVSV